VAHTFDDLLVFLFRELEHSLPSELSEESTLQTDLNLSQEDAKKLLDHFFAEFQVEQGDFNFTRYFPAKGGWLLGKKQAKAISLTPRMLLQAARAGQWITSDIERWWVQLSF
jgi:hypothetical protein